MEEGKGMSADDEKEQQFKDWLDHAGKDSGQKISDSAAFIGVGSTNYMENPLCALQLGLAILMDKPIFMIVDHDRPVPKALVKVADCIERVKMNDPRDMKRAQKSIQQFLQQLKPQG